MATKTESILSLLTQIRNDQQLVLPDLQRDFVWGRDQIRLLLDSIMRGYPFGSLLFWQTRFLEVPYREFVIDYLPGMVFVPKQKPAGTPLRMVLDGQQRLQSLYLAIYGTHDKRRLYFNVASGPEAAEAEGGDSEDEITASYRFEFWHEHDVNRPKRLVPVADLVSWPARYEDQYLEKMLEAVGLTGEAASRARRNVRLLRAVVNQGDLVPVETIDENAPDKDSARTINEILDIFVRVNTGGTKLSRSDLMFSLLKTKWSGARMAFDGLVKSIEHRGPAGIDKDFIIRGLLAASDAPISDDVKTVERHWGSMEESFERFSQALRNAIDFIRSPDVGLLSSALFPSMTLHPVVYYLCSFANGSVPDAERRRLRAGLYFLLFNNFVKSEARIRYLRDELKKHKGAAFPLDGVLKVIAARQVHHYLTTTAEMLNLNPRLTLNVAQPTAAKETLSWQEKPEVDHVFPQSVMRPKYGDLVDDVGNLSYLGKLRNIRKSDAMPLEYFADVPDDELASYHLIGDRALLAPDRFEDFVRDRRERIVRAVAQFLGR
jgi:hypothetical protein